jgi:hypothetical protein
VLFPSFNFDFVLDLGSATFSPIVLLQCYVCFKISLLLTPVFCSGEARVPLAISFSPFARVIYPCRFCSAGLILRFSVLDPGPE